MIEGKNVSNMTDSRVREVARAVAKYHKIVEDFPIEKSNYWTEKWEWMIKKYDLMKKVRPKNKLDRLMKDNLEFFDNLLKKLLKIKINKNILLNHADFNKTNLLWEGNKLVGIIDFENISFRPRAFDVSYIRRNDSQDKIMLEEYRKYNSFSKSEEKNLIVFRLLETCNLFWWNYLGMDKRPDLKYIAMKRDIGRAKRWVKMWEKGN
jgi:Ser/Thr protein kinase RdoA (MazF antagonist)